jgi:hypothetical protein
MNHPGIHNPGNDINVAEHIDHERIRKDAENMPAPYKRIVLALLDERPTVDACIIAALETKLQQAEKQANCDCVPCLISSKSCRKCGRKATIPQDQLMRSIKDYEARLAKIPALIEAASNAKSWIENYPLNANDEADWIALTQELSEALADSGFLGVKQP